MTNYSHAEQLIQTFKRFKQFTITASEPFMYEQKQMIEQGQGHIFKQTWFIPIQSNHIGVAYHTVIFLLKKSVCLAVLCILQICLLDTKS